MIMLAQSAKIKRIKRQSQAVRILLLLLIFTPLLYTADGDPYRAYEVVIVGILFILLAPPNVLRVSLWKRTGLIYIVLLALIIAVQPFFLPGLSIAYNVNYIIVLISCFVPSLYLSSVGSFNPLAGDAFIRKLLDHLFVVAVVSLVVSFVTGLGEVYLSQERMSGRAFAWLGDSFSPVMVFFLYYYLFSGKKTKAVLAAGMIIVIMQAKMALVMAVLGYLMFRVMFDNWTIRLLIISVIALSVALLPVLYGLVLDNIHNFEYSLNNRWLSIEAGLQFFRSSPFFGVGANQTFTLLSGGFDVATLNFYDEGLLYYEFFQIHNAFIRILAELGVIGFLLFGAFCVATIRRSRAVLRAAHASPQSDSRALLMACALWIISFVLFYQSAGWFEPGHPQLAWLICFLTLMNFCAGTGRLKNSGQDTGITKAQYFDFPPTGC